MDTRRYCCSNLKLANEYAEELNAVTKGIFNTAHRHFEDEKDILFVHYFDKHGLAIGYWVRDLALFVVVLEPRKWSQIQKDHLSISNI